MLLASTAAISLNQLESNDLEMDDDMLLEIEDPEFEPIVENDEPIAAQMEDENTLAQEDKKMQELAEKDQAEADEEEKKSQLLAETQEKE